MHMSNIALVNVAAELENCANELEAEARRLVGSPPTSPEPTQSRPRLRDMGRIGLAAFVERGVSTDAIAGHFGVPVTHIAMLLSAFGLPANSPALVPADTSSPEEVGASMSSL